MKVWQSVSVNKGLRKPPDFDMMTREYREFVLPGFSFEGKELLAECVKVFDFKKFREV